MGKGRSASFMLVTYRKLSEGGSTQEAFQEDLGPGRGQFREESKQKQEPRDAECTYVYTGACVCEYDLCRCVRM